MICERLQDCLDRGWTTATELKDILDLERSGVYRYLNGVTPLRFSQFRALFRHLKDERARLALLEELLGGTPFIATHLEPELDLNGDGDVDISDAVAGAAMVCEQTAGLLKQLLPAVTDDKKITETLNDDLQAGCDDLIRRLVAVKLIADAQYQRRRRRRLQPKTVTGGPR